MDQFSGDDITQFVSSNHNGTSVILTTKVVNFTPVKEWTKTVDDKDIMLYKQAFKNIAKKWKK